MSQVHLRVAEKLSNQITTFELAGGTLVLSPAGASVIVRFAGDYRLNPGQVSDLILAVDAAIRLDFERAVELLPERIDAVIIDNVAVIGTK